MSGRCVKVLIVDDSQVSRELLTHIYSSDPEIHVVGTARNGEEAIDALRRMKPDVISMDIQMPKMNGYEATRIIMSTQPVPIVIVSSSFSRDQVAASFQAMEAGAVALSGKPKGPGHPDHATMSATLVKTIKAMSEVKVVRHWNGKVEAAPSWTNSPTPGQTRAPRIRMVAMGVSTGGPPVLQTILSGLPKSFPAPIVIVQHIAAGFLDGLRDWLAQSTGLTVQIATHGGWPEPGQVYLAPDGTHLGFDTKGRIVLSREAPDNGLRPSVAHLFRSAAAVFGDTAVGIILTGMGRDGADELKLMRDRGAVTIAQDKPSSVVHGMPGEAIAANAATHVLPPERITATLLNLTSRKP